MSDFEPTRRPESVETISQGLKTKMTIFREGLRPSDAALKMIAGQDGKVKTTKDYGTTQGIIIEAPGRIYINAPFPQMDPFTKDTKNELDYNPNKEQFVLKMDGGTEIPVRHIPTPEYLDKKNKNGIRYGNIIATHTDRARVSPIMGCALDCQFCNMRTEMNKYLKWDVPTVLDAVQVALDDPVLPAQHLLISGGTPGPIDFEHLHKVYKGVMDAYPGLEVDVMMTPSFDKDKGELLNLEWLKKIGINALSINLELFNQEVASKVMPRKSVLGQKRYLDFIEQAVNVFGPGRVRSMLITGIEPVEDTLKGMRAIAERGASPEISPYRPEDPPSSVLGGLLPPSVEDQISAYLGLHEILDEFRPKNGIKQSDGLQCEPCMHNAGLVPNQYSYSTKYDRATHTTKHVHH